MNAIAERVAAGAKFLDEHDPDWWHPGVERAIDLDTLNMEFGNRCVLGQRCPLEVHDGGWSRYQMFAASLSGHASSTSGAAPINAWAHALGFYASDDDRIHGEYAALTAEWQRVIEARRSA